MRMFVKKTMNGTAGWMMHSDTPLRFRPSFLPSPLPAAPPAINRLASVEISIPGANIPLARGPTSRRMDFTLAHPPPSQDTCSSTKESSQGIVGNPCLARGMRRAAEVDDDEKDGKRIWLWMEMSLDC